MWDELQKRVKDWVEGTILVLTKADDAAAAKQLEVIAKGTVVLELDRVLFVTW